MSGPVQRIDKYLARKDLVRVDSLRAGQSFSDCDGRVATFLREHGGAHVCRRADGSTTYYAGCAMVVPSGVDQ